MELKLSKKITKPDFQGEFTASILAAAASPEAPSPCSTATRRAISRCARGLPSVMRSSA